MITDLLIYEIGEGGDLALRGNDLVKVTGQENTAYLAMFGGNKYWGNYMYPENPFSSKTEEAMRGTELTSAGRIKIENAIKKDLEVLDKIPGTTWTVATSITGNNRLAIKIVVNGKEFSYLWNPDTLFLTYTV